jgi:hypothetical protein
LLLTIPHSEEFNKLGLSALHSITAALHDSPASVLALYGRDSELLRVLHDRFLNFKAQPGVSSPERLLALDITAVLIEAVGSQLHMLPSIAKVRRQLEEL